MTDTVTVARDEREEEEEEEKDDDDDDDDDKKPTSPAVHHLRSFMHGPELQCSSLSFL